MSAYHTYKSYIHLKITSWFEKWNQLFKKKYVHNEYRSEWISIQKKKFSTLSQVKFGWKLKTRLVIKTSTRMIFFLCKIQTPAVETFL